MAHSLSAKKRIRQSIKRRARNRARKEVVKDQVKTFLSALSSGDVKKAQEQLNLSLRNGGSAMYWKNRDSLAVEAGTTYLRASPNTVRRLTHAPTSMKESSRRAGEVKPARLIYSHRIFPFCVGPI